MHDGACPGLDSGMPHRPFATATTPPKETVPTIGTRIRARTVSDKGAVPLLHYRRKRHDDYEH